MEAACLCLGQAKGRAGGEEAHMMRRDAGHKVAAGSCGHNIGLQDDDAPPGRI